MLSITDGHGIPASGPRCSLHRLHHW
jgi:hypothetical protein